MANYFENTPKYTIWTPKMIMKTAFWGVVLPYAVYKFLLPVYVRISWSALYPSQIPLKLEKKDFMSPNFRPALTALPPLSSVWYRTSLKKLLRKGLWITVLALMSSRSTVLQEVSAPTANTPLCKA